MANAFWLNLVPLIRVPVSLFVGVARRAEDWRWGSLWLRHQATMDNHTRALRRMMLAGLAGRWPNLKQWTQSVNAAQTKRELSRLEVSEKRSQPFVGERWMGQTVVELGLEHIPARRERAASESQKWRPEMGAASPCHSLSIVSPTHCPRSPVA